MKKLCILKYFIFYEKTAYWKTHLTMNNIQDMKMDIGSENYVSKWFTFLIWSGILSFLHRPPSKKKYSSYI